ncbi:MAG TPA: Vps62-related protein [Holophaga sp.]|nr:Vps62-related protein [Holophaga sp.]
MKSWLLLTLPSLLAAGDGPDPNRVKEAIQRYAPILVLHDDEKYLPTSVEEFLAVTTPCTYKEDGKDHKGLQLKNNADMKMRGGNLQKAKTYVNVKVDKASGTLDLQYWFLYAFNGPGTIYTADFKSVPSVAPGLAWFTKRIFDTNQPKINTYELKELGVHEGDWEHLTVRVSAKDGRIVTDRAVFMSAHGSGGWLPAAKVLDKGITDPTADRVWAYASKNGHALFPRADRYLYSAVKMPGTGKVLFGMVNDASKVGSSIDYGRAFADRSPRWQIFGVQGDDVLRKALMPTEPAFIQKYPDRWGRFMTKKHPLEDIKVLGGLMGDLLKKVGAYDEFTLEAGPQPPWKKDIWTAPETGGH